MDHVIKLGAAVAAVIALVIGIALYLIECLRSRTKQLEQQVKAAATANKNLVSDRFVKQYVDSRLRPLEAIVFPNHQPFQPQQQSTQVNNTSFSSTTPQSVQSVQTTPQQQAGGNPNKAPGYYQTLATL